MKTNSITFRLILGAALWVSGALAVSGFLLATLFADQVRRSFETRMTVQIDALVAASTVENGKFVLGWEPASAQFQTPLSGWYWQISAAGEGAIRSRSLWDQDLNGVQGLASGDGVIRREAIEGPGGKSLMVVAQQIRLPELNFPVQYTVAVDEALISEELRPFNVTLGWSLGIIWIGLMVAALIQVRYGLRPLRRIRAALAEVRSGQNDHLDGDFPPEVTPLVEELNAHLNQIAEVVERARTHVGNLAHALKTPLSVLRNDAGSQDGALADTVRRQSEIMQRRVDHYLVRARTAATGGLLGVRTEIAPVADDLRRTLLKIHRDKDLAIDVAVPTGLAFRGDRQDLEEIIGNVLDNACKWAKSRISLDVASPASGEVLLAIEDDGPGLTPEEREEALGRGKRLDETVPGSGLGMSIIEEISGLYGGEMRLDEAGLGGLRVEVKLPGERAGAA